MKGSKEEEFLIRGVVVLFAAALSLCSCAPRTRRTWAWVLLSSATERAAHEAREELSDHEHARMRAIIELRARGIRKVADAKHRARQEGAGVVAAALAAPPADEARGA